MISQYTRPYCVFNILSDLTSNLHLRRPLCVLIICLEFVLRTAAWLITWRQPWLNRTGWVQSMGSTSRSPSWSTAILVVYSTSHDTDISMEIARFQSPDRGHGTHYQNLSLSPVALVCKTVQFSLAILHGDLFSLTVTLEFVGLEPLERTAEVRRIRITKSRPDLFQLSLVSTPGIFTRALYQGHSKARIIAKRTIIHYCQFDGSIIGWLQPSLKLKLKTLNIFRSIYYNYRIIIEKYE